MTKSKDDNELGEQHTSEFMKILTSAIIPALKSPILSPPSIGSAAH